MGGDLEEERMSGKGGKITLNFILEQLDENELDLSMNGMDTVPVNELVELFLCS